MEEFNASLTQFFTDWGYVGLFLSAFVAGSILPFSSEVVLVILVRMGLDPLLCLFSAASGEYARRYDLLLDRAFGQAGLDYPLPAGPNKKG